MYNSVFVLGSLGIKEFSEISDAYGEDENREGRKKAPTDLRKELWKIFWAERCVKMDFTPAVRYCVGVPPVAWTYQRKISCMKVMRIKPMDQAKFSAQALAIGGTSSTEIIVIMTTLWK